MSASTIAAGTRSSLVWRQRRHAGRGAICTAAVALLVTATVLVASHVRHQSEMVRAGPQGTSVSPSLTRARPGAGTFTSRRPDTVGTVASRALPGGAWFAASTWEGTSQIAALQASVPPGSPVAVAAYGGVVIGRSSLRSVVSAWGGGFATAADRFDDYAVRYLECVGSLPVVVKFDQTARTSPSVPGAVLWEQPVTSVLIGYADEPSGSDGCR